MPERSGFRVPELKMRTQPSATSRNGGEDQSQFPAANGPFAIWLQFHANSLSPHLAATMARDAQFFAPTIRLAGCAGMGRVVHARASEAKGHHAAYWARLFTCGCERDWQGLSSLDRKGGEMPQHSGARSGESN